MKAPFVQRCSSSGPPSSCPASTARDKVEIGDPSHWESFAPPCDIFAIQMGIEIGHEVNHVYPKVEASTSKGPPVTHLYFAPFMRLRPTNPVDRAAVSSMRLSMKAAKPSRQGRPH